ncbi:hypothetical protein Pmar_PMAR008191 [Perkinsus marinus ATCC 50983]|uniref:Uncharacterized protein n=1 Tax=Perkinsus marinus (strain ATCC 50983 / TXsc) TaxID=423536 RepID=C5LNH4_PERM5|nr:hypothetical protein Pmar_PMAR008191 [Perkinsus marinus ATCC 50983]EER01725.1 hypothetical protein Pmar_PMAR008191 [Perkinsus marinus ATCC 50983]|eukprot:XP_002769007.1 hypothetical protein Pmar_PMAR008191 [Perkinsus marinus ATCC 50983]
MPARVRMPANNYMSTSATLQTHGIWKHTIKYDPHASEEERRKELSREEDLKHGDDYNAQARSINASADHYFNWQLPRWRVVEVISQATPQEHANTVDKCMNLIDIDDLDNPNPKKSQSSMPVMASPPVNVVKDSSDSDEDSDDSEDDKKKKKRRHHHHHHRHHHKRRDERPNIDAIGGTTQTVWGQQTLFMQVTR